MEQSLYTRAWRWPSVRARERPQQRRVPNPDAWLGIITAGKTYNDLRQAFLEMGLDDAALRRYGIRILKMGMLFPMEPDDIVRDFAQAAWRRSSSSRRSAPSWRCSPRTCSTAWPTRRASSASSTRKSRELLPHYGEFESDVIARALHARLSRKARIESAEAWLKRLDEIHSAQQAATSQTRTAWYCSGCPHNSLDQAPDGSIVSAGIGCHTMAMWMDRNVVMGTHMGAEGAQWIGMAPFTDTSTSSRTWVTAPTPTRAAWRSATARDQRQHHLQAAAQRHTSMTGGQEIMGASRWRMVSELLANGVKKIIVTTDDLSRYNACSLVATPRSGTATAWIEAQRVLAAIPGTTVLIHDQECAAELRRAAQPRQGRRAGCRGDRHQRARVRRLRRLRREVQLHERRAGADRVRPQDAHPPVVVQQGLLLREGLLPVLPDHHPQPAPGRRRQEKEEGPHPALERELPAPVNKVDDSLGFGIHVMGIGGTGSVTVAATMANAARLEGKHVIGLDQTGLAQKGGAVISDIKITHQPFTVRTRSPTAAPTCTWASTSSTPPTRRTWTSATPSAPSRSCPPPRPPPADGDRTAGACSRPPKGLTAGIDRVTRAGRQRLPRRPGAGRGPVRRQPWRPTTSWSAWPTRPARMPLKAESIEDAIQQLRGRRRA
jgi:indolepyruvate ferredoxin oxidoreductase